MYGESFENFIAQRGGTSFEETIYMKAVTDSDSFFIEYAYGEETQLAEVKTCCDEDNAFYYDILINNQYQFTITQLHDESGNSIWRLALKNADTPIDPQLVQIIGKQIDLHHI